jgi:copper oxidase (laccase) domain-containing protein
MINTNQFSTKILQLKSGTFFETWISTRHYNFSLTKLGTEQNRAVQMKNVVQSVHNHLVPFFPPLEHTLNVICLKLQSPDKQNRKHFNHHFKHVPWPEGFVDSTESKELVDPELINLDVYLFSGTWVKTSDYLGSTPDNENSGQIKVFTFTSNPDSTTIFKDSSDSTRSEHTEQLVITKSLIGQIQKEKIGLFNLDDFPLADGIITDCSGIAPGVTVADCFPIFLGGNVGGDTTAFGLVHSGWKGTGILAVAAYSLTQIWDIPYSEQEVIIGPGICGKCYPVGSERAEILRNRFGNTGIVQVTGSGEFQGLPQPGLDLPEINRFIAEWLGIKNCTDTHLCTFEHDLLWSHRRFQYEHAAWLGRRDWEANGISIQNQPEPIDGRMFAFITPYSSYRK